VNSLEELTIYSKYVDLYNYTFEILKKYPKLEINGLVSNIKNITYEGFKSLVNAQKAYNMVGRKVFLNEMDANMKVLKVLVRISYKQKYINGKNYKAWSKKITEVTNMMGGWIKACQKA
jgi:hypothetical protein